MNVLAISGRLTKDIELKGGETAFASFSIGHNIGYGDKKEVNFFDCKVFGKTAEFLSKYAAKGDEVLITGRLQVDTWMKDDEKKSKVVIYVTNAEIGRKKNGAIGNDEPIISSKEVAAVFGSDGDVPF